MAGAGFRFRDRYWPRIADIEAARRVARRGFWAAVLVAGITALFAILAVAGYPMLGIGPLAFIDVLIFGAIAWGISKMSRIAALTGLVLFVVEKFFMWEGGVNPFEFIAIVAFSLVFMNAVRATLKYHRLRRPQASVDNILPVGPR